jgi:hypothetical protein
MANQEYIPGVCNIGPAEIARRRMSGWTGLAATAVLWVLFVFFDVPAPWRLTLFIPATMSATGFLQAYFHFCAGFGFTGVYNLVKPAGQTETIQQKEFRRKDRQKALQITGLSALTGALVAIVAYSFPL